MDEVRDGLEGMTDRGPDYWDGQASSFDDEADHGLQDPEVRRAWSSLLAAHLPAAPAEVADLGCGTGSLSVLLAEVGYEVHGVDLSGEMVAAATAKAERAGVPASFQQADAADPPLPDGSFDVVLSRHVLWALPDPCAALERWIALLRPGGRLLLVEGSWSTGAGISAAECERLVRRHRQSAHVRHLTEPELWGRKIDDERYLLVSAD